MSLSEKECIPCSGKTPALSADEREKYLSELSGWKIEEDKKLVKSFSFKDFNGPMTLANKIWEVAEKENHHPDLTVVWGELKVVVWTHAISNLSESDFILASKIDKAAA